MPELSSSTLNCSLLMNYQCIWEKMNQYQHNGAGNAIDSKVFQWIYLKIISNFCFKNLQNHKSAPVNLPKFSPEITFLFQTFLSPGEQPQECCKEALQMATKRKITYEFVYSCWAQGCTLVPLSSDFQPEMTMNQMLWLDGCSNGKWNKIAKEKRCK